MAGVVDQVVMVERWVQDLAGQRLWRTRRAAETFRA